MSEPETKYGVINEDGFSLRSPRSIDGDECTSLKDAMEQAARMIEEDEAEQVSIVRCIYSAAHEGWVEVPGESIEITAHNWTTED